MRGVEFSHTAGKSTKWNTFYIEYIDNINEGINQHGFNTEFHNWELTYKYICISVQRGMYSQYPSIGKLESSIWCMCRR